MVWRACTVDKRSLAPSTWALEYKDEHAAAALGRSTYGGGESRASLRIKSMSMLEASCAVRLSSLQAWKTSARFGVRMHGTGFTASAHTDILQAGHSSAWVVVPCPAGVLLGARAFTELGRAGCDFAASRRSKGEYEICLRTNRAMRLVELSGLKQIARRAPGLLPDAPGVDAWLGCIAVRDSLGHSVWERYSLALSGSVDTRGLGVLSTMIDSRGALGLAYTLLANVGADKTVLFRLNVACGRGTSAATSPWTAWIQPLRFKGISCEIGIDLAV